MKEESILGQNLIDDKNYRPYCGAVISFCYNPRTELRPDGQFIFPNCKWISSFPEDLIKYNVTLTPEKAKELGL